MFSLTFRFFREHILQNTVTDRHIHTLPLNGHYILLGSTSRIQLVTEIDNKFNFHVLEGIVDYDTLKMIWKIFVAYILRLLVIKDFFNH